MNKKNFLQQKRQKISNKITNFNPENKKKKSDKPKKDSFFFYEKFK
jgi:hypothetical protein